MKHSDGKSVFHNDKTPIQRAWGVTEQSDDYENDGLLNHQISAKQCFMGDFEPVCYTALLLESWMNGAPSYLWGEVLLI